MSPHYLLLYSSQEWVTFNNFKQWDTTFIYKANSCQTEDIYRDRHGCIWIHRQQNKYRDDSMNVCMWILWMWATTCPHIFQHSTKILWRLRAWLRTSFCLDCNPDSTFTSLSVGKLLDCCKPSLFSLLEWRLLPASQQFCTVKWNEHSWHYSNQHTVAVIYC